MAKRRKKTEKEVIQYEHNNKERLNNPPAELASIRTWTEQIYSRKMLK